MALVVPGAHAIQCDPVPRTLTSSHACTDAKAIAIDPKRRSHASPSSRPDVISICASSSRASSSRLPWNWRLMAIANRTAPTASAACAVSNG